MLSSAQVNAEFTCAEEAQAMQKSVPGHLIRFMPAGMKGLSLTDRVATLENALRHILLELPELDGPMPPCGSFVPEVGPQEPAEGRNDG